MNVVNVGAVNTERTPSSTDSKQDGTVPAGSIGESPGQRAVTRNADASAMSGQDRRRHPVPPQDQPTASPRKVRNLSYTVGSDNRVTITGIDRKTHNLDTVLAV